MKDGKKWVAVYARVSKKGDEQESGKQSQIHELRQYAKAHHLSPVRLYCDKGSGAGDHLPKLDRLRRRIAQGHVHTVLVWEISRLSRRGIWQGMELIMPWVHAGIKVISVRDGDSWEGADGEYELAQHLHYARKERERIIARIKRGLDYARAKGVKLGPPTRIDASKIVTRLRAGGMVTDVAAEMKVTPMGIYKALKRQGITIGEARGR